MVQTRQLLLLRHAKSSRKDPGFDDFDRPLSERGLHAAPSIGREMARRDWIPQKALVSAALRTRDTWRLISEQWTRPPQVEFLEAIYEASADDILAAIRKTAKPVAALLVVGHNPGMEDFALRLASNRSDARALDRLRTKFPTAALARFEFDGEWRSLMNGTARLTHFIRPRDLA